MHVLECNARHFDLLLALNENDADDWAKYVRTKVITNIAHLNTTGCYSKLDTNRVIFVGRYTRQKGIPDLFKIWEIVFERHPDWHIDLFGDGNMEEIPYSEEERLMKNIHVHQPDSHIFERYLESSVFVLTSVFEPFGLVMPEAMSCGLPVVAFDCPSGPAQIITDGVDGFLIKNRDVELFADKVCSLIESTELRHAMGKAAIESSRRYSTDHIMVQWMSLFKELIASSQL
jgi:glycosyltransferase involved in cell wall biosynthesis